MKKIIAYNSFYLKHIKYQERTIKSIPTQEEYFWLLAKGMSHGCFNY